MIRSILLKELKVHFRSPITYVILGLFTLIIGWLFFNQLVYFVDTVQKIPVSMRNQYDFANQVIIKLFGNINFILLFLVPILSMKSFSEEYKMETINLYFSSAVSDYQLVIAKFLSLSIQGIVLLSTTLVYPLLLSNIDISDFSFVISGYLGLVLNLMCFCSLGLLASSLGKNQVIASLVSFILILLAWMIGMLSQMTSNFTLSELFKFLSINAHFENLVKASVSFSDLSFYFSFMIFFLFLLKKRIEARLWL